MKLYRFIAAKLAAIRNCNQACNVEWLERHRETLDQALRAHLPSGSGFDASPTLCEDECTDSRLVFSVPYHPMDENGGYCAWVNARVVVRAHLHFEFTVSARGAGSHNEYIAETYGSFLGDIDLDEYTGE